MKKFLIRGMYLAIFLLIVAIIQKAAVYYLSPPDKVQIYDLTWSDPNDPGLEYKWRYYINPDTCLPVKIEKYTKTGSPNQSYKLTETLIIDYPADDQIQKLIDGGI